MALIIKFKLATALLALSFVFFGDNLAYRNAEGGKIKILVPEDFLYQAKAQYKPKYQGDAAPDDYFFSRDTSEEILVLKMPVLAADLITLRPTMTAVTKMNTTKVYFNDTTTVNRVKMYITELDAKDGSKLKHIKTFIFNAGGATYMGGTACLVNLKNKWIPVSERVVKSLRIN